MEQILRLSTLSPASHSSSFVSGLRGWSYILKRSIISLKGTVREDLTFKSHEVNMYPTDPLSEGIAVIEYVVLKRGLGDLDIERWSPLVTVKSRIAKRSIRYERPLGGNTLLPFEERVRFA